MGDLVPRLNYDLSAGASQTLPQRRHYYWGPSASMPHPGGPISVHTTPRLRIRMSLVKEIPAPISGGRGCLEEGRLGVPGQVWEFRFLPLLPSIIREIAVQEMSGKRLEVPDILLPDIRGLLTNESFH